MSPTLSFLCAETAAPGGLGVDWSVLGIVLLGVTVLMFAIRGVGLLAARSIPEPGAKPLAKKRAVASKQEDGGVTPELVAVLTAAAAETLGSPVRILEISAGKMAAQRSWSQEGRREIYLSHRFR